MIAWLGDSSTSVDPIGQLASFAAIALGVLGVVVFHVFALPADLGDEVNY